MEGNWRPAQGDTPMTSGISAGEWRSQLPPESRQKIVNKIMETLKRHLPRSVPEGLNELRKIAVRFEEKIYTAAVSQEDYLRKISLKMLSMESKTQQPAPINPAMSISGNQNPGESGPLLMHSQGNNSNQGLSGPNHQSMPQNIQNNISVSMQGSSVVASTLPAMSALTQSNIPNVQNMPGMSQTSMNNPISQGGQNDIYANAQRMLQGRQQLQQQQSQNSSLYQNQFLLKQKMQQSSLLQPQATQASLMQMSSNHSNNIQQAQAANMQSSQQQQNHIQQSVPTMLQPNSQTAANQQGSLLQQQAMPVSQQMMGQQRNMSNISNMQQSHPHSQHNNISEQQQQQQQQQQRMPIQQNNLLNIQPQQIMNQQQLNSQSNMSGLQQHLLGSVPAISNMQPHRTMMMPKNAAQQQTNQPSMSMLQTQGQQAQHQSPQQLMSQFQNQPNQIQQQMLMQHSNSMQREIQQRMQGPNNLLQGPAGIDQKPFIQAQRLPEISSSTSIESTTGPGGVPDWQEECYQKVRSMRELYYNDIKDFHEKIDAKLQQQEPLGPPGNQSEQLEKLKTFRHMLDRMLTLLNVTKSNIPVGLKDKLPTYETQIVGMIASHRSKKAPPQGQGKQEQFQHPVRTQQPSLASQLHLSDNSQVNTANLQGSGASLQNMSMHSPATHQNASNNTMQSTANNNDPVPQASSFNSMQQSGQQNSMNASQQNNTNTLNQNAMNNTLQSNVGSMQTNTNVLHQHVKQEQQQLLQTHQSHQLKQQLTQRHLQHMHQQRQQQLLQHQQQQKQQLSSQPSAHQVLQQLQSRNEPNELKPRQVSGNKFDFAGQRQHYYQQIKSVTSHPSSSPQNFQASSPQISYHSSPQIDQNGPASSVPKANTTHIPSGNSPLAVTSAPFAPSPIQVEHEKPITSMSQLGHGNQQQSIGTQTQSHSVAVNTPGISASPLLEECPPLAGNQSHVLKMSETDQAEKPMDRLIKAIRTLTPHALSSSVSDIGSVVSMVDRIAGSAPGNGSRTAVGEDLVAMTKCRLQARNFMSHDVGATSKKMKRHTSAMPLNNAASAGSVNDSFKHLHGLEPLELESTATSSVIKRFKSQISHCLKEEIREINQKLIDTVVDICDEDADSVASSENGEGAVVRCSYTAVALNADLKAQLFATAQTFPIAPLRLLVPVNYPKCSPVLLDGIVETSMECEDQDLSTKAKSKFSVSIRCLSQPMSLKEMVKTWDACVRKVILEYAQQFGGGSFSSTFGSWEYCIDA